MWNYLTDKRSVSQKWSMKSSHVSWFLCTSNCISIFINFPLSDKKNLSLTSDCVTSLSMFLTIHDIQYIYTRFCFPNVTQISCFIIAINMNKMSFTYKKNAFSTCSFLWSIYMKFNLIKLFNKMWNVAKVWWCDLIITS